MINPFLTIPDKEKLYSGEHFFILKDKYPVSPGHLLIISHRDVRDYFELRNDERIELTQLIDVAKEIISRNHSPNGFNLGMNCGEAAGQTVFHFHCHIIPRYKGDMMDPRGGVRHCISGKGYY